MTVMTIFSVGWLSRPSGGSIPGVEGQGGSRDTVFKEQTCQTRPCLASP